MENTQEQETVPVNRVRCRRVGGKRRDDPHRHTTRSNESILSSTTLLLTLAASASMICPVAAASIHQACTTTSKQCAGTLTRRERRDVGERNKRFTQNSDNRTDSKRKRSGHKFFESLVSQHIYYSTPPGQESAETRAASKYDPTSSSYVSSILPEYSIGEPVWIYNSLGWFRATIEDNICFLHKGLYKVKPLDPDKVGITTMFLGGPHVLRRNDGVQTEDDDHEIIKDMTPNVFNVDVDPLKNWKLFFESFGTRSPLIDEDILTSAMSTIRRMSSDGERRLWLKR